MSEESRDAKVVGCAQFLIIAIALLSVTFIIVRAVESIDAGAASAPPVATVRDEPRGITCYTYRDGIACVPDSWRGAPR